MHRNIVWSHPKVSGMGEGCKSTQYGSFQIVTPLGIFNTNFVLICTYESEMSPFLNKKQWTYDAYMYPYASGNVRTHPHTSNLLKDPE